MLSIEHNKYKSIYSMKVIWSSDTEHWRSCCWHDDPLYSWQTSIMPNTGASAILWQAQHINIFFLNDKYQNEIQVAL